MRIEIPVHLRWSDMDAYGHVNNVDMMRLLEIARIEAFWSSSAKGHATGILEAGPQAATYTLVARHEVEYQAPLEYRAEPVIVELWIGHIGGASIDISYRITDPATFNEPRIYALASTTLVMVDRESGTPRRISTEEREAWLQFVEAPVTFRHRR